MAIGREKVEVIVTRVLDDELFVIQIPEAFKQYLDGGSYCEDYLFKNKQLIPIEKGIYKLFCELFWDDGKQPFFEDSDPDWYFIIEEVEPLYQLAL